MNSFWDFLWLLFWSYVLMAYLMLLFHIFGTCSEIVIWAGSRRRCGRSG